MEDRLRILIADDEKELVEALEAILEFNGYEVDTAFNGVDASYKMETEYYDAVLLDIMMPGMDGITVLKSIRQLNDTMPIIIMSAKSSIQDRVYGLESGADDYLVKPFASSEMLARLRVLLRRSSKMKAAAEKETACGCSGAVLLDDSVLSCCDLKLDQNACMLYCKGKSARLTNHEYKMMSLFLENRDRVLSTQYLVENVWGYEMDTDNNAVWAGVSRLRKLLSSMGSDVKIRSSRGLGYFLEGKK